MSTDLNKAGFIDVFTFVLYAQQMCLYWRKSIEIKGTEHTTDTQPRAGMASLTADRLLKNLLARFFSRKFCNKQEQSIHKVKNTILYCSIWVFSKLFKSCPIFLAIRLWNHQCPSFSLQRNLTNRVLLSFSPETSQRESINISQMT